MERGVVHLQAVAICGLNGAALDVHHRAAAVGEDRGFFRFCRCVLETAVADRILEGQGRAVGDGDAVFSGIRRQNLSVEVDGDALGHGDRLGLRVILVQLDLRAVVIAGGVQRVRGGLQAGVVLGIAVNGQGHDLGGRGIELSGHRQV